MNQFFAPIYEKLLGYRIPPEANCNDLYFDSVYNSTDYLVLFIIMTCIPLGFMLAYYKGWDPSLPKVYNWLFFLLIAMFSVGLATTYGVLPTSSMESHTLNGPPDASYMSPNQFNFQMGIVSTGLSVVPSMIFAYLFRFISKNNTKNPF